MFQGDSGGSGGRFFGWREAFCEGEGDFRKVERDMHKGYFIIGER